MRCDVFVLTLDKDNKDWINELKSDMDKHPIIQHWVKGIDDSLGDSRKLGFSKGVCEYVSYMDSDDRLIDGVYETLIKTLDDNPNCPMVFTGEHIVNEKLKRLRTILPEDYRLNMPHLCSVNGIAHSVTIFRRSIVERVIDDIKHSNRYFDFELRARIVDLCLKEGMDLPIGLSIPGRLWRIHRNTDHNKYISLEDRYARGDIVKELYIDHKDRLTDEDSCISESKLFHMYANRP